MSSNLLLVLSETFTVGGIQTFNRLLCRAAAEYADRHKLGISVMSLNDPSSALDRRYLPIGEFWGAGRNESAFIFRFLGYLSGSRPSFVIFGHANLAPLLLVARLLKPDCYTAVALHGIEVWQRLSPARRLGLRYAQRLLSVSRYTAEQTVMVQGVQPERITLLPDALDPILVQACQRVTPVSQGSDSEKVILLTVSRLSKANAYKGVDTVLNALPRVLDMTQQKVEYWIVGDGDDLPRQRQLARDLGVSEQVRFWGQVATEELVSRYAACDVFVMPSRNEGFGIVFLEAMFFGKPAIACMEGASPEVVSHGETGLLVPYGDVCALAGAVLALVENVPLRRQMGQAGRQRLLDQFTFDHFTNGLARILDSAASGQGTREQSGRRVDYAAEK